MGLIKNNLVIKQKKCKRSLIVWVVVKDKWVLMELSLNLKEDTSMNQYLDFIDDGELFTVDWMKL